MSTLEMIIIAIIAIALWVLYHKIFHVIYFHVVTALIREAVICIVIACFIVVGGKNLLSSIISPNNDSVEFLGTYVNTQKLEDPNLDCQIIISENQEDDSLLHISGLAFPGGNYSQHFDVDIPIPTENTFSVRDEPHGSTLTITYHPDSNTLTVEQTVESPETPIVYSGEYVDSETWQSVWMDQMDSQATESPSLFDEAEGENTRTWYSAYQPYFGTFVREDAGSDIPNPYYVITLTEGSDPNWLVVGLHQLSADNKELYQGHAEIFPTEEDTFSFSCDGREFVVQLLNINGILRMEVTEPNHSSGDTIDFAGLYLTQAEWEAFINTAPENEFVQDSGDNTVSSPETSQPELFWTGTYTCQSDGPDGIKSVTFTQIDDQSLSFSMKHTYADGRTDATSGIATIGTYNNGPYFASYEEEKILYFTLEHDSNTGKPIVTVSQVGIYPEQDLEYMGTYQKA